MIIEELAPDSTQRNTKQSNTREGIITQFLKAISLDLFIGSSVYFKCNFSQS